MAEPEQLQQFRVVFDDRIYDSLNSATLETHQASLEQIAQANPYEALELFHAMMAHPHSVDARSMSMRAPGFVISSREDGMHTARGGILWQIEQSLIGGCCLHPSVLEIDIVSPRSWAQQPIRSTRNRLLRPITQLVIAVEPPSFAM